jgi:hypothetical protein
MRAAKTIICIGVVTLIGLAMVRIISSGYPTRALGQIVAIAGVSLITLGVAEMKGADLGFTSLWRVLVIVTAIGAGVLIEYLLRLGKSTPEISPMGLAGCIALSAVLVFGWWRLIAKGPKYNGRVSLQGLKIIGAAWALVVVALLVKWVAENAA